MKLNSILILGILQQFTSYMTRYNLDIENAKELILKYAKRYQLNKRLVSEMLLELQLRKKLIIEETKTTTKILKRTLKLRNSCNNDNKLSVFVLSVSYMGTKDIRNLLILNKTSYKMLKKIILKHVLKTYQVSFSSHVNIWIQILDIVIFLNN